jgi:hypothetical protein
MAISMAFGDPRLVADCLNGLAAVATAREQSAEVVRLAGAESGLRDAIGVPIEPVRRESHRQMVEELRASLGEGAFAEAWAAGVAEANDENMVAIRAGRQ